MTVYGGFSKSLLKAVAMVKVFTRDSMKSFIQASMLLRYLIVSLVQSCTAMIDMIAGPPVNHRTCTCAIWQRAVGPTVALQPTMLKTTESISLNRPYQNRRRLLLEAR